MSPLALVTSSPASWWHARQMTRRAASRGQAPSAPGLHLSLSRSRAHRTCIARWRGRAGPCCVPAGPERAVSVLLHIAPPCHGSASAHRWPEELHGRDPAIDAHICYSLQQASQQTIGLGESCTGRGSLNTDMGLKHAGYLQAIRRERVYLDPGAFPAMGAQAVRTVLVSGAEAASSESQAHDMMRLISVGPVKFPITDCVTFVGLCAVTT